MLAVHFDGALALTDVPTPTASPADAVVRVRLAGICGTDLAITRGYADHRGILGHEFVGQVESCADATWIGRRVVAEINVGCGACERCARGDGHHCATRTVVGIRGRPGCFAERVVVPVANLHPIPAAMPDELAVFTEPLAAAFEILEQVPLAAGDRVAVLGDGKLGLLVAMVLRRHGCDVTVIGRHPHKLAIARAVGAHAATPGSSAHGSFATVVEATGAPTGLEHALALVRPRGTLVLKSTFDGAVTVLLSQVVVDELTIVGSRCGPFATAIAALADGSVDPRPLLDQTFPLSRALEAFARARTPGVLKVVLDPRA